MIERIKKYDLSIDKNLYNFINLEVLPDTNINKENFWKGFSNLVSNFDPINKKLLFKRDTIQKKINEWHKINNVKEINYSSYKDFLYEIEYLVKEGPDFKIDTIQDIENLIGGIDSHHRSQVKQYHEYIEVEVVV